MRLSVNVNVNTNMFKPTRNHGKTLTNIRLNVFITEQSLYLVSGYYLSSNCMFKIELIFGVA